MSRLVITDEQKAEAVRIAIEGKSPVAYLKGIGLKNPSGAWFNIKSLYREKHPEIYAQIPQHEPGWKTTKQEDVSVAKLDGAVRIKMPDGTETEVGSLADGLKGMADAAADFFGKCEEMGLNVGETKPEITKPLNYDGLTVTAVTHPNLGEWYFDRKYNAIDWRTPEGDEVSLTPAWWIEMAHELKKILNVLGVNA